MVGLCSFMSAYFFPVFLLTLFSNANSQPLPSYLNVTFIGSYQNDSLLFAYHSVLDDHMYGLASMVNGNPDVLFFQLLRNGSLGWINSVGSVQQDIGVIIAMDSNNLYMTGSTNSFTNFNGIPTIGDTDIFVIKVGKNNGSIQATTLLGTPFADREGRIAYCSFDNTVLVTWSNSDKFVMVSKLNTTLGKIWERNTTAQGEAEGIMCTADGTIYATGSIHQSQILYLKMNSSGNILIAQNVTSTTGVDKGNDIVKIESHIFIAGYIGGNFSGYTYKGGDGTFGDPIVVKVDESTGAFLGYLIYNATAAGDEDRFLIVDSDNNLLVHGRYGSEVYVNKINASTLSLIWQARIQGNHCAGISRDPYRSNSFYVGANYDTQSPFYNQTNRGFGFLGVIDTTASVPSPSPTPTRSVSPSMTPSISSTPSVTPTTTPSASRSSSHSPTPSISVSPSPSTTPSPSVTPSSSPSQSPTSSRTPSISTSPSSTTTPTSTPSQNPSVSTTPSLTPSMTPSTTPSTTASNSVSPATQVHKSGTPKDNTAAIVAGVVVGVAVASGLVLAAFMYKRRRTNKASSDDDNSQAPDLVTLQNITIGVEKHDEETEKEIKKETETSDFEFLEDIEIKEVIGSGNFGEVYRGLWKDTEVALKKFKVDDKMDEFIREASMLQKCSFPNTVAFFGLHKDKNREIYMVTEFMSDGDLNTLLRKQGKKIPVKTLVEMARDAAAGIKSMANMGLVHRDLAARNLLVHKKDGKYTVKVADFGLARHLAGNYYTSIKAIKWSAPEVLKFEKFSVKSDVWSFGIVLWEIFENGSIPYRGMGNNEATEAVLSGYRLPQPSQCPNSIYKLMMDCWAEEPSERPSFDEIYQRLEDVINTEELGSSSDDSSALNDNTFYANRTEIPD